MDEGTGQRADGAFKENEDQGLERHPVRVLIRDEEVGSIRAHSWMHVPSQGGDAAGHGWSFKAGQDQEGVEGQVYVMSVQHEGAEDQMDRGSFLRWLDPKDTEGEGVGPAVLYPADPDDLEAQGFKSGVLKPDASGSWSVEFDDN